MAVSLWAVPVDRPLTAAEEERLLRRLPQERRAALAPLLPERRREPLCAWALLWTALRTRYGWTAWPALARGERGKPFFPDAPHIHFSLSHTAGAVLVAVAEEPVGVDIQRLRPMAAKRMLTLAGTDDPEAFFRAWVRREARGKRTGAGIGGPRTPEPPPVPGERVTELATFPGCAAAVAASGEEAEPLRVLSLETLAE